tara:strand:+ start:633 stop:1466 length:834 start_codon:yes stop_codon:yes gene_type:complete
MNSTTEQSRGNLLIRDHLTEFNNGGDPVVIGKMGNSEFLGLRHYLRGLALPETVRQLVTINAGVVPDTDKNLNDFFKLYYDSVRVMDISAQWLHGDADFFYNEAPETKLVELRSLEPYYHSDPWSSALEGQNVTVVSPFSDTVKNQYAKREMLWEDENVLPEFNMATVQSPYLSIQKETELDWFTAFDSMCTRVLSTKPNIVLVGAGAYSLPLLYKLREEGISGVHLGGATQILFGIRGARWDEHDVIGNFYNDHWVRPGKNEIPDYSAKIEGGCYW